MNAKERAELYMALKKDHRKTKKEELKEYHESLKLGDKLEWLFKITGIKWLVKKIYPNCNCDERRDMLNDFKFKRK